ncbi:hypothetical protein ARMGADRAFT_1034151 [Armillaria gallica]|uniref:Uncharacterized protein n=1 Tax=Armillaria gallica TaxID=47427 RepID=A0A2H3CYU9_ARMGA|nr:hypothetical protein ARMGADRAFT_1034151 [Armillaria gallica]
MPAWFHTGDYVEFLVPHLTPLSDAYLPLLQMSYIHFIPSSDILMLQLALLGDVIGPQILDSDWNCIPEVDAVVISVNVLLSDYISKTKNKYYMNRNHDYQVCKNSVHWSTKHCESARGDSDSGTSRHSEQKKSAKFLQTPPDVLQHVTSNFLKDLKKM